MNQWNVILLKLMLLISLVCAVGARADIIDDVTGVYRARLGRFPSGDDVNFWAWYNTAYGWAAVYNAIANSAEGVNANKLITDDYRNSLGRYPSQGEISYWLYYRVSMYGSYGFTVAANEIAASAEATTVANQLNGIWRTYLGRYASGGEKTYWLYNGVSVAGWLSVQNTIIGCQEAQNAFASIDMYYRTSLGRGVSRADSQTWLYYVVSLQGFNAARDQIAGGQEATNATSFVELTYRTYLGRHTTPGETKYWLNYASYHGFDAATNGIRTSQEGSQAYASIDYYYRTLLGRSASHAEAQSWLFYVASLTSFANAKSQIAASPEAANATAAVQGYYRTYLGRAASPSEIVYWLSIAANGGMSAVVTGISTSTEAGRYHASHCNLAAFNNSTNDASDELRHCISLANGNLALPPGNYMINQKITIDHPLNMSTAGLAASSPKCTNSVDFTNVDASHIFDARCARFVASPTFKGYMFEVDANDVTVDHVIFDGNGQQRRHNMGVDVCGFESDERTHIQLQYNFVLDPLSRVGVTRFSFTNNAGVNAYCHGAFEAGFGNNYVIRNNTFAYNGIHTMFGAFAVGVGMAGSDHATVSDNYFMNNTDGDIQIGSCTSCKVQNNRFEHTTDFRYAVHAAFIIGAFTRPYNADFTGTDISHNTVDCPRYGGYWSCGIGFEIGQDRWLGTVDTPVKNGYIHDNIIKDAAIGFELASAVMVGDNPLKLYNNVVSYSRPPGKLCVTNLAKGIDRAIDPPAYNVSPTSTFVRTVNTAGDQWSNYAHQETAGFIPNITGRCGLPTGIP